METKLFDYYSPTCPRWLSRQTSRRIDKSHRKALRDDIDSHRTSTGMTYDPWI